MSTEIVDFISGLSPHYDSSTPAVSNYGDSAKEYAFIRDSVGVCDFSFLGKLQFEEIDGGELLDSILPDNILKLRYGSALETFLADDSGRVIADVEVVNLDGKLWILTESALGESMKALKSDKMGGSDISSEYAAISIDGPSSWKVARKVFGEDIMNLSYMAAESYDFASGRCLLVRDGKTGEFGYKFIVKKEDSSELFAKILDYAKSLGGGLCGFDAHSRARLESGFFNIYKEGKAVGNPLELGLQWMIDFSKDSFLGSNKILSERKSGYSKKLVCFKCADNYRIGSEIVENGAIIGNIVSSIKAGDYYLSLGNIERKFAYSGLDFSIGKSVSRPLIVTKSMIKGMDD